MIWKGYCACDVQHYIKEIPDYITRIKDDPLELLVEVETMVYVPQKAKYPPLTLVEVLSSFLKVKQGENESLMDYINRFKSKTDIVTRLLVRD